MASLINTGSDKRWTLTGPVLLVFIDRKKFKENIEEIKYVSIVSDCEDFMFSSCDVINKESLWVTFFQINMPNGAKKINENTIEFQGLKYFKTKKKSQNWKKQLLYASEKETTKNRIKKLM